MEQIYQSICDLIGNTPLLRLNRLERAHCLNATLLAKLEGFNPAGSVKDRAALAMIERAEQQGKLAPSSVIIEPTSGNTGIALSAICAVKGYRLILVMPETMSIERRQLIQAYGAQIVLTSGAKGMKGAIEKASALAKEIPNSFILGQFLNPANPLAHERTTGPEIWKATNGNIDLFIAGIGTGGTITGAGKYLKEQNPLLHIIGVEPTDSPVLSGGSPGPHRIQGIGAGFVPAILDTDIYDQIIQVNIEDAFAAARAMAQREGILVGISSGAALWAALETAKLEKNAGKTIVVILPDTGERYLSTPLFADQ